MIYVLQILVKFIAIQDENHVTVFYNSTTQTNIPDNNTQDALS